MLLKEPYFMKNPEWYVSEYDDDLGETTYMLTDKATLKAVASYKDYVQALKENEDIMFSNNKKNR